MSKTIEDRAIAMAGIYQAVDQVIEIAWRGRYDPRPFEACIRSLFAVDARSFMDVYGGPEGIRSGLESLQGALSRRNGEHTLEQTRYVVTLIHLEGKLNRNSSNQAALIKGIEAAGAQLEHFGPTHTNVISNLAEIYRTAVSTLGPRVMVKGEQAILSNPDNAARIRAMLLSGIRAAVLWRQAGGNRWRLLLERRSLLRVVNGMLDRA